MRALPTEVRAQLREMLSNLDEAVDGAARLQEEHYVGEAADGEVTASVTVGKALTDISISRMAVRNLDNETLGEAVAEAINAADAQADEARTELMNRFSIGGIRLTDVMADPMKAVPPMPEPRM